MLSSVDFNNLTQRHGPEQRPRITHNPGWKSLSPSYLITAPSPLRSHGTPGLHPRGRQRPGYDRHRPLVRPARASDLDQLAHQVHRRPPRHHDVPLGALRRALWRVQHRPELERAHPGPAPGLHGPVPRQLGPDSRVRARLARLDDRPARDGHRGRVRGRRGRAHLDDTGELGYLPCSRSLPGHPRSFCEGRFVCA